MRPETSLNSGRKAKALGPTPRTIMRTGSCPSRRVTGTRLMFSGEAIGCLSASIRMPGAFKIAVTASRGITKPNSSRAPPLMTMARPGSAAASIDRARPTEKDSIDKRTPTTQAMPTTITSDAQRRWGRLTMLTVVTATIC